MLYDVVIIGGGPAGLTAGLYAARARLKSILIEKAVAGGQVVITERIENYPGFKDGISGTELSSNMEKQAKKFGLKTITDTVVDISLDDGVKKVALENNGLLEAKSIILTSGANPKSLNIEGEEKFRGRGVSYCATCDAAFFRDEKVAVIGGGDSAVEEAVFLTKFAEIVYIVHRRDSFRASMIVQERAFSNPKMKLVFDSVAEKIEGEDTVKALHIRNVETGEKSVLEVKGVFIYVGYKPNTGFLKGLLALDNEGYIITGHDMSTSVEGIFAAGDVRTKSLKQISTSHGLAKNGMRDLWKKRKKWNRRENNETADSRCHCAGSIGCSVNILTTMRAFLLPRYSLLNHLGKAGGKDSGGQGKYSYPEESDYCSEEFPQRCDWTHVSISNCCQCYNCPIHAMRYAGKTIFRSFYQIHNCSKNTT